MESTLIKPKALQKGDQVALISLSWGGAQAFPLRYEIGKRQIQESFSLRVVEAKHAKKDPEWLRDNPEARADDLMSVFTDPDIKGIISIIGGSDSYKIIPYVDLNIIKENPKIFMGYSDTTMSHFLCYKAGLSSFYGPAVMTSLADGGGILAYTRKMLEKTLFASGPLGILPDYTGPWCNKFVNWGDGDQENKLRSFYKPQTMKFFNSGETVKGKLIGGCVETLVQMIETEIWPTVAEWENKIIFLEISEDCTGLGHLKDSLKSLSKAGMFSKPKAILFGRPSDSIQEKDFDSIIDGFASFCQKELKISAPIVCNVPFGHSDPVLVLPYGREATVNSERKEISIDEAATS